MNRRGATRVLAFDKVALEKDLLDEAKRLKIPVGSAEKIAAKVAEDVGRWTKSRPGLTRADLEKRVTAELSKYNDDLAYVYQNRGKII